MIFKVGQIIRAVENFCAENHYEVIGRDVLHARYDLKLVKTNTGVSIGTIFQRQLIYEKDWEIVEGGKGHPITKIFQ
jgi:hypothetical protein